MDRTETRVNRHRRAIEHSIDKALSDYDTRRAIQIVEGEGVDLSEFRIRGFPLMIYAVDRVSKSFAEELYSRRPELIHQRDSAGNSALMLALINSKYDPYSEQLIYLIYWLIDVSDVNLSSDSGMTALHFAAQDNDDYFVNELIRRGASADARNNTGQTPSDLARDPAIRNLLIRNMTPFPDVKIAE